ncbi:MAG: flagellar export chaperone FlgN [Solidesulfovibrio sp.]|uniref:flagellar export chaperone FlgN n=1 Tax=Solidesulfovibrio sp. TaxID=2910990 RepID=UPI002B1F0463|nr:flagellar export chaperone FlgN [Solidesulfovibrio sp.]MEA4857717.1 flagellar export chaperone FlgN [Solidesulfovibrio sp.]
MIERILSNLDRQRRAVELLRALQKEEFAELSARNPEAVASLEFSIQELLRQLAAERRSLHALYAAFDPAARRLFDIIDRFPPEAAARARVLHATIDAVEQACAKQAGRTYAMALGLYDMAKGGLENLRALLVPKKGTYGARGRLAMGQAGPSLVNGRL